MKKIFIFISFILCVSIFAQNFEIQNLDAELHEHSTYTSYYNVENQNPDCVIWRLTNVEAIESEAVNNRKSWSFIKCGSANNATWKASYKGKNYDKGHMCPNNDRDHSVETAEETFKACNICPQIARLNRGIWQEYEKYGHKLAKKYGYIDIACGPIYTTQFSEYIPNKRSKVRIPDAFYKIFYNKEENVIECYIFTQESKVRKSTIEEINEIIGFDIILQKD